MVTILIPACSPRRSRCLSPVTRNSEPDSIEHSRMRLSDSSSLMTLNNFVGLTRCVQSAITAFALSNSGLDDPNFSRRTRSVSSMIEGEIAISLSSS
jgi:hypothetical protein